MFSDDLIKKRSYTEGELTKLSIENSLNNQKAIRRDAVEYKKLISLIFNLLGASNKAENKLKTNSVLLNSLCLVISLIILQHIKKNSANLLPNFSTYQSKIRLSKKKIETLHSTNSIKNFSSNDFIKNISSAQFIKNFDLRSSIGEEFFILPTSSDPNTFSNALDENNVFSTGIKSQLTLSDKKVKPLAPYIGKLLEISSAQNVAAASIKNAILDQVPAQPSSSENISLETTSPTFSTNNKLSQPKTEVSIAIFSDLDSFDDNGAIAVGVKDALRSGVPFIAPRSLISNTSHEVSLDKEILARQKEWSIYEQKNAEGEGFLVFIPKESGKAASLASLDLRSDGSLQEITAQEAFIPPKHPTSVKSLRTLFVETPQKNKIFYLEGHGNKTTIGGLDKSNYTELLNILKAQQCVGLAISSCHSGGTSSLMTLEVIQEEKAIMAVHSKKEEASLTVQPIKFPILVRSISDFATISGQEAEKDLKKFFNEFGQLVDSNSGLTVSNMRKMVKNLEGEEGKNKKDTNLNQVYFPSGADSPAGFRPLGEKGESYPLTYLNMQKNKLQPNQEGVEPAIKIANKHYIELHPVVINQPLHLENSNPKLLSIIPGQSAQYLKEIKLAQGDLATFFSSNSEFYANNRAHKSFYLATLTSPSGHHWQGCLMSFEPEQHLCLYREGNKYFRWNGKKEDVPQEISKVQYSLAVAEILEKSKGSARAIASQTGGQQDNHTLDEIISENSEISSIVNRFKADHLEKMANELKKGGITDPQEMRKAMIESLLKDIDTQEGKEAVVFALLSRGKSDLAMDLIDLHHLSVDMKNMEGIPLIITATITKDTDFLLFLLSHGANPNVHEPINANTPLHLAIESEAKDIVKIILNQGNINLEYENFFLRTPIYSIINNQDREIYQLMKEKGAKLFDARAKKSFISHVLFKMPKGDLRTQLLEDLFAQLKGEELNYGSLPLNEALKRHDTELIHLLLEKGAKLDASNANDRDPPIFQSIKYSHPDLVKELLKQTNWDLNVKDGQGRTLLMVALEAGNSDYVKILTEKGAIFPQDYSLKDLQMIRKGIQQAKDSPLLLLPPRELKKIHSAMFKNKEWSLLEDLVKLGLAPPLKEIMLEVNKMSTADLNQIEFALSPLFNPNHAATYDLSSQSLGKERLEAIKIHKEFMAKIESLKQSHNNATVEGITQETSQMIEHLESSLIPSLVDHCKLAFGSLLSDKTVHIFGDRRRLSILFNEIEPYINQLSHHLKNVEEPELKEKLKEIYKHCESFLEKSDNREVQKIKRQIEILI